MLSLIFKSIIIDRAHQFSLCFFKDITTLQLFCNYCLICPYKIAAMCFKTIFDPDHAFLWNKWTGLEPHGINVQPLPQ